MEAVSAAVYDYTPTQNRIIELYKHYRTALMNAKFYARRIERLKRISMASDILTAAVASAAFGSLAVWKSGIGTNIFTVLLGASALISALRPVLRITDKVDRYSKLHYGYLEVYYRIDFLIAEMKGAAHVTPEQISKASEIADKFMALELEGDAHQSPKILLKYQDEIDLAIPPDQLWLPPE